MTDLGSSTSPTVTHGVLVLLPLGSTEQHGPHLPLSTDTIIATAVAHAAARTLAGREATPGPMVPVRHTGGAARDDAVCRAAPDVVVAPALAYGSSGEHDGFAGTVSTGTDALVHVIIEIVRSMDWAGRVVLVNGHGGNLDALHRAVPLLRREGRDVAWVPCPAGRDAHAGHGETSLLLHLRPDLVRLGLAEAGAGQPVGELLDAMRAGGVRAVAPNGVLGDPSGATAAHGARLLDEAAALVVGSVREGRVHDDGRLGT